MLCKVLSISAFLVLIGLELTLFVSEDEYLNKCREIKTKGI